MAERFISLRSVEVHNLKSVNLDLPHGKLIVFCGMSGSGKTSLALDTLYAEGQRRYIESFSAYSRQFLDRLEKPAAERIDGIPPAIAVTHKNTSRSSRSTIGTATEISDYLRLLYAKIGQVICTNCGQEVRRDSPQSTADMLMQLPTGRRYLVAFPTVDEPSKGLFSRTAMLREDGFLRVIVDEHVASLNDESIDRAEGSSQRQLLVVVDRLSSGSNTIERIRDSVELAFNRSGGRCSVFVEGAASPLEARKGKPHTLDGVSYRHLQFSRTMRCEDCGKDYPEPEPRLYSFNSPLGACPECEGFGNVVDVDMDLVVPDPQKSIREGAIAPWTTPAYEHELKELLALAPAYGLPVDVPFRQLTPEQVSLVREGVPERNFGGMRGFFAWLERKKYKMHVRVFLSRWRSYRPCPACGGSRLRPEALATRVGGLNIAEVSQLKVRDAITFFCKLELTDYQRTIGRMMLEQVEARLGYLHRVGLEYLTLDRTLRTLSGGESQRVTLTTALGSSLVNMLYVLDEPSVGLHPRDTDRLISAVEGLRDRGNTVVVVEHEESMIRAADQIVEIGPGAGERGGQVIFQGSPVELEASSRSSTGDYLTGRRGLVLSPERRKPNHGWLRLAGARGNNLKNITVEFPLGMLCLVTGVSGSGKSTLVQDTLYPALRRRMRQEAPKPEPFDNLLGDGQIDEVILVDQNPIGRSPRSNPVTYLKAFDEIRAVFAETVEAKTHNYTASYFSFNVEGGRCNACEGDGYLAIDMQFLADVYMKCPQCKGRRYRPEILKVKYRGRSIADVLEMTVREAFTFFRGSVKVQARLKRLIDVGLDYLRLGQPANTLSGGEAQRLKLAGYMSTATRSRTLFILDEPTTGLHFSDVVQLLDCFNALLDVGHSLIIVEHNVQVMKSADYIIDLGPGAAEDGGRVVVQGTPEAVAKHKSSFTGKFLAEALVRDQRLAAQAV